MRTAGGLHQRKAPIVSLPSVRLTARRMLSIVVAVMTAFAGLILLNQPAQGAQGACPTADGVTVVVDATPLGGALSVRCATGKQNSGLDALRRAGFSWSPVSSQPAMVCRIDGLPSANDEPCVSTPPAKAYWGYYRANRGGDWRYSSVGAAASPIQGGVEGWVFLTATQRPPGVRPPAAVEQAQAVVPTPTPTNRPTKSPKPTASKSGSATSSTTLGSTPEAASPANPQGQKGSVGAPLPEPPGIATAPAAAVAAEVTTADAMASPSGGGSMATTLLGVVILAGLVVGAVVLSARRRRSS